MTRYVPRQKPGVLPPDDLPEASVPAWLHPASRSYLMDRGLTRAEIEFYDLHYTEAGDYRNRVIIPMYDLKDELAAFQARCLDNREPRYLTCGPRPIYKPWDISEIGLVDRLVAVEGPFDLYSVARVHAPTVATLGIQPSERQIEDLVTICKAVRAETLVLWFDHKAEKELYDLQLKLQPRVRTEVLFHDGESKDPGSLSSRAIRDVLKA